MACFTHALPDHRQQHPDEFCHIFTEIDEIVIMIKINQQMNNSLNINAVEIVKKKKKKKKKKKPLFSSACNAYYPHHSTIF